MFEDNHNYKKYFNTLCIMTESSLSKMLPRINNYSMLKEALLEETKMLTRTFTINDKRRITFGELVKYFGELVNSNADTVLRKDRYLETLVVDSFKDTDVTIRDEESMDSVVTVFDNIIFTNYLHWFDKLLELVASQEISTETLTLTDITNATGGCNEYKSVQRGGVINPETAIMIMVIIKKKNSTDISYI